MSKEFNPVSDETFKKQTFAPWEINSARFSAPKTTDIFVKPPVKKEAFTLLSSTENSSIFKHMSEADVITSKDTSPEGEVAHLSHRDKVFRAMHGGSKPEVQSKPSEDDFKDDLDLTSLLGEQNGHEKNPEALAKKLGPGFGIELRPFRAAVEGKEHIILESEDSKKLVKVDKFSADGDIREEKAKTYRVLEELFPDRLPHSELFNHNGETGVVVDKVQVHPQFEEARKAAKNGDQKLWNEITKSYFSDVMDEANEMGIDLWNSIDADERDNFVTNKEGNQIFVDDFWIEANDILAANDNIVGRMKENPDKYPMPQQEKVLHAIDDLKQFVDNKNQPKSTDKSIPKRELTHA